MKSTLQINNFFPGELKPNATVGGCIDIFEKAWPMSKNTIEMIENECSDTNSGAYWTKAETFGHGPFQNIRTNRLLPVSYLAKVSGNSLLQNIHNQFYIMLLAASNPYVSKYGINESLYHEGYNLLKYGVDEEYKGHYDGGTNTGRAISAICYLNDDYEGGEIEFPYFNVKIKPEAGMLILFPSNFAYRHIAHPVTSGTKYAMVTWIHDRDNV
jgi:predicted 2-oxoglutarate/Fe(II)-dependent dioxygenase YbiX